MAQLIRKISPRTVFGDKEAVLDLVMKDKSTEHKIFRVVGICRDKKEGTSKMEGETDKRPWTGLLGAFQAWGPNGEVYRSGVCFLPNYVMDSVLGALEPGTDGVHFAFDVTVKFDKESATSYVYGAIPLMEPAEDDPVMTLANQFTPAAAITDQSAKKHDKKS